MTASSTVQQIRDRPSRRASDSALQGGVRRLLYLAGPGDVIGAHLNAQSGGDDRRELALTYSGRVIAACRRLGVSIYCVVARSEGRTLREPDLTIEEVPIPLRDRSGVWYHLGQVMHAIQIAVRAWRVRPDMALIATPTHWFMYTPLSWMGIKVVPSLHGTLWPAGKRPRGLVAGALQRLNRRFWRRHVHATLAVSDECARQVHELAGELSSPIHVAVAQYEIGMPPTRLPPPAPPLRVLFAGRIEATKGIWDALGAAELLDRAAPGELAWVFAGNGSDLEALRDAIRSRGLGHAVDCVGHLSPAEFLAAIDESHVLLSPTTSDFCEGLQKVAVEGVLRCRPVVTTRFSNAFDLFGDALIECEERSPRSIAEAVLRLKTEPGLQDRCRSAAERLRGMLFDRSRCYGTLVGRLLEGRVAPDPRPAERRGTAAE